MKKVLIVLAVLAAIVAGGLFWAYNSLDFVVKSAIERYAPGVAGVPVKVDGVHVSATDGRGTVKGFEVANPAGYRAPYAIRVGEISVGVQPSSLTQDIIVIDEIVVQSPQVNYEISGGTNNLEAIQKNIEVYVKSSGGESTAQDTPGRKGPARKFIFGHIVLRSAKVTMANPLLKGGGITFEIPDIELRDLGKRTNGITAAEAAKIVTNALIAKIAQKVLTNIDLLRKGGKEGALEALKGLIR
jgi:hypothetical protein